MTVAPHDRDASPYRGGDPWADYRSGDFPFTEMTNLADRVLGASVIAANDEFFANREVLLHPERPVFDPEHFGDKGKIMDGWETRRHRPFPSAEEHDWALVRLGVPGVIHGVLVDTAHFRGNYPPEVDVEGTCVEGTPGPEDLLADDVKWEEIVPRSPVYGHAANGFEVTSTRRYTHLRIKQIPDGGIARLRVHGEAVPDPRWLRALGTFDLVCAQYGGVVEDASDRFFSSPTNVIRPDQSRKMDDGWETRRRRVPNTHDWVRFRLAGQGEIRAIEIDTAYLKGNAAGSVALHGCDATTSDPQDAASWFEILPETALQPDSPHRFRLDTPQAVTHVRLDVFPDGGIARLRLHGSLTEAGQAELTRRYQATA